MTLESRASKQTWAGGQADATQASLINTLGKFLIDSVKITWSIKMNIQEAGYPSGFFIVRTVQIDGSGPVAQAEGVVSAQGSAHYSDHCEMNPKAPGLVPCNPSVSGPDAPTMSDYAGTLDWKMTFQP